jgi:hypothetical protein
MDLFRRLFRKPSPEVDQTTPVRTPAASTAAEAPPLDDTLPAAETDDIAETRPVVPPVPPASLGGGITRSLSPETVISSLNEHNVFGLASDVGQERHNNQDSALSFFFTSRSADERPD